MRTFITLLSLSFILAYSSKAQGLEKLIVEKYYIADKQDAAASNGRLPVGAITYRIYADLQPGYRLQAVYGVEDHEMKITTTTGFYNHTGFGGNIPNVIPDRILHQDLAMLDSWLSMGAASEHNWGVLKTEDDTANTIMNKYKPAPLLQNTTKKSGIPVRDRDGLMRTDKVVPKVIGFGLDSLLKLFDKTANSTNGVIFQTNNGSWACLEGSVGPLESNRVLIAQLTTDGKLYFELNIQIGTPDGGVERYVARNPKAGERKLDSLIYPGQRKQ
jgi:hypothetical protein